MTRPDGYLRHADAVDHLALQCGAHGYSRAQIAACIGISRKTIIEWANKHPRFAEVLERADTLAQAWWEGKAQDGTANKVIGGNIWGKSMSARFPSEYAERQEIGTIGDADRVTEIRWKIVSPDE